MPRVVGRRLIVRDSLFWGRRLAIGPSLSFSYEASWSTSIFGLHRYPGPPLRDEKGRLLVLLIGIAPVAGAVCEEWGGCADRGDSLLEGKRCADKGDSTPSWKGRDALIGATLSWKRRDVLIGATPSWKRRDALIRANPSWKRRDSLKRGERWRFTEASVLGPPFLQIRHRRRRRRHQFYRQSLGLRGRLRRVSSQNLAGRRH